MTPRLRSSQISPDPLNMEPRTAPRRDPYWGWSRHRCEDRRVRRPDTHRCTAPACRLALGSGRVPDAPPRGVCQVDLFEPRAEIPVCHRQTRRAWVVTAELGYSRARGCAGVLEGAPRSPVGDEPLPGAARRAAREARVGLRCAIHSGSSRASEGFACFCGQLSVGGSSSTRLASHRTHTGTSAPAAVGALANIDQGCE